MKIDPNVQVAIVSVFATTITTLGVIFVAIINNRKERSKSAEAGVKAGMDEAEVLERMLDLMSEKAELQEKNDSLTIQLAAKEEENTLLKRENTRLRLRGGEPDGAGP